ncbi:unnamed protein product [Parnassius apollo]|uniref:(apollo) hypothetical protein n=1 Tax=Parnassius apollo TaxID=110799 RepID=A0A8S3XD58_PARAO|nr:unnamed protein product [Parnassius apollo]
MGEKVEVQPESLLNLDDLLQCPVCYEIPTGQIFQCNEGHHVCGRCKVRLDVCPVCRALFFGTRNYAMEELIANFRKLRAFKFGGKLNTGSGSSESSTPARDAGSGDAENETGEDEENNFNVPNQITLRAPQACKGLFRCLCCKNGNAERLPSARLLNHLRYYHSHDLIEGQSENGEYLQAWQLSTVPGRIVTAVRVSDMGIFFLVIEIGYDCICAWLTMAASPWVANEFCYTVTLSGNDREAIFSDCVWSVRSCEGSLKKRGHCLIVQGADSRGFTTPVSISGKLSLRRTPVDQLTLQTQPRAVMRVANRGTTRENVLQDLQYNVERLSRAFATLEANALHSEDEIRARMENTPDINHTSSNDQSEITANAGESQAQSLNNSTTNESQPLSRNARRRMRQRLRAALNATQPPEASVPAPSSQTNGLSQSQNSNTQTNSIHLQLTPNPPPVTVPQSASEPSTSTGHSQNGTQARTNKKKRRHRR